MRIPPAPIEGPDADEASIARIRELRTGEMTTLYRTLLHSGNVAAGWCALGTAVRFEASLPDDLRELLICLVARSTGSTYEWASHAPLARAAGVTEAQLDSLPDWRSCATFTSRQRHALALGEGVIDGRVDDATHRAAMDEFGYRQQVEIITTTAYYLAVSRFLQACGVGEGGSAS